MQISDKTVELFYPAACGGTAVRRIHTAIKVFSKDSYLKSYYAFSFPKSTRAWERRK